MKEEKEEFGGDSRNEEDSIPKKKHKRITKKKELGKQTNKSGLRDAISEECPRKKSSKSISISRKAMSVRRPAEKKQESSDGCGKKKVVGVEEGEESDDSRAEMRCEQSGRLSNECVGG